MSKKLKRYLSLFLLSFHLFTSLLFLDFSEAYARPASIALTASSAYMLDAGRKQVLYSKRATVKRAPASTIKVMTALLVAERMKLDSVIKVPRAAESIEPSKIYLRQGERYTVRSLLKAVLLASANDAAYVLAVATAGSHAKFADLMTRRAKQLGATRSRFKTANGLPAKGQYSTSRDLALIMKAAVKNPVLVDIMRKKTAVIYSLGGRKITLRNHNKLLWRDPRDIIGKTGWTRKARYCL